MKDLPKFLYSTVVGLTALCFLISCSSSTKEPKLNEISTTPTPILDSPEVELLENGKRYFQSGLYSLAIENFQSLVDAYPLSEHVLFAETKIADCHFLARQYGEAAVSYEEAFRSHPAAETAPYALLQAGRSLENLVTDLGRDRGPLDDALEKYNTLIQRYPNSPYAKNAYEGKKRVLAMIADYELMISRYYEKFENEKAASARRSMYEKNTDLMKSVVIPATDSTVLARLSTSPPPPPAIIQPTNAAGESSLQDSPIPASSLLQGVTCRKRGSATVVFDLRRAPASPPSSIEFSPAGPHRYAALLPFLSGADLHFDCFGKRDVTLSEDGTVSLLSASTPNAFFGQYPPRIVVVVEVPTSTAEHE